MILKNRHAWLNGFYGSLIGGMALVCAAVVLATPAAAFIEPEVIFSKIDAKATAELHGVGRVLEAQKAEESADNEPMEDEIRVAAATPNLHAFSKAAGEVAPGVPAVLSANDVKVYKEMFRLQRSLQRSKVAALIPQLDDPKILMGHLIALRILHPLTKTSYRDMAHWLDRYYDESPAPDIYRVAMSRHPRGVTPRRPSFSMTGGMAQYSDPDDAVERPSGPPHRIRDTKQRRRLLSKLQHLRRSHQYSQAVAILEKPRTAKTLGDETYAEVSIKLARYMMQHDAFADAQKLAEQIIARATRPQPEALWINAFAAYRQGNYDTAASGFRRMAYSVPARSSYYSRAAWWAATSYEKLNRNSMARVFLNMAAKDTLSFYGLLANAKLNRKVEMDWSEPTMDPKADATLFKDPGIRRVIALVQIGEHALAQEEMKAAYSRVPYGMDESLLALSMKLNLPAISMTLAKNLQERHQTYLSGLYPHPDAWQPLGGFKVDAALIYAISRQESGFDPRAQSYVGARGLMQVMPSTAQHMRDIQNKARLGAHALYEPNTNMMLGQDYLLHLDQDLDSDLVKMVAAYNAGPGNIRKWTTRGLAEEDPVLFIESIPFEETRKYVMKVMSNLWVYRHFFYNEAPSLTQMASGQWPVRAQVLAALKNKQLPTE